MFNNVASFKLKKYANVAWSLFLTGETVVYSWKMIRLRAAIPPQTLPPCSFFNLPAV